MKNKMLIYIRVMMMVVNFIAVGFVAFFTYFTTRKICDAFAARDFIDTIEAYPGRPFTTLIVVIALYALLIISFIVRENRFLNSPRVAYGLLAFDFAICVLIVMLLDFNYNGLFFMVFAGVLSYAKGDKGKYLMICLALVSFLLTDADLLSINYNLYSINNYFNYYDSSLQQYLVGGYNLVTSVNIILFIVYCILLIQEQKGTIDEVSLLNEEIKQKNEDLQNANLQLAEYAKITEKMGETKERNRLAREIHDTLGHTLTGISVGLDACITTVEIAPKETKAHLEKLSQVARNGLVDIRRSVSELKPDSLERLSLYEAITKMIDDMKSITDMQITFESLIDKLKFDEDEESAIYRVVQESLTNAMRHGKASQVHIRIEKKEDYIELSIKDNGIGCIKIEPGFGTKHIAERIEMLNGTVSFKSENGFTVLAKIPIRWGEEYD